MQITNIDRVVTYFNDVPKSADLMLITTNGNFALNDVKSFGRITPQFDEEAISLKFLAYIVDDLLVAEEAKIDVEDLSMFRVRVHFKYTITRNHHKMDHHIYADCVFLRWEKMNGKF